MKIVSMMVTGEMPKCGMVPVVAEVGPVRKSWYLDCRAVKSFRGSHQSGGYGVVVERIAVAGESAKTYAEPSTGDFGVRIDIHEGGTIILQSGEDEAMSPAFPWTELLALLLKWLSTRSATGSGLVASSELPMTSFAIFP